MPDRERKRVPDDRRIARTQQSTALFVKLGARQARHNFAELWYGRPTFCDLITGTITPLTMMMMMTIQLQSVQYRCASHAHSTVMVSETPQKEESKENTGEREKKQGAAVSECTSSALS